MDAPNTSITSHLEGFMNSARKLEGALSEEKIKSQRIAQEYLATRTTLENGVRELQNRLLQRENKIQAISEAFRTLQLSESRLKQDIREISDREKKANTDLAQYQSAWNEVLARESQARGILIDYEKAKRMLAEANQSNITSTRQAENYRQELQGALIQIQNAEAKYQEIQNEISLTRNQMNAEIERVKQNEKQVRETAISRLRIQFATHTDELNRIKSENLSLQEAKATSEAALIQRAERAEKALVTLRNEAAMNQMELAQLQLKFENTKKENNKAFLIERLRNEATVQELATKIDSLMNEGLYVEKIETAPESAMIYTAVPGASFSDNDFAAF